MSTARRRALYMHITLAHVTCGSVPSHRTSIRGSALLNFMARKVFFAGGEKRTDLLWCVGARDA
jgi:hypothetical protein